jgi:hypothetical protein
MRKPARQQGVKKTLMTRELYGSQLIRIRPRFS